MIPPGRVGARPVLWFRSGLRRPRRGAAGARGARPRRGREAGGGRARTGAASAGAAPPRWMPRAPRGATKSPTTQRPTRDEADDRRRERVLRADQRRRGPWPWAMRCSTFSWITKPTATTAARRPQREDAARDPMAASPAPARRPEAGGPTRRQSRSRRPAAVRVAAAVQYPWPALRSGVASASPGPIWTRKTASCARAGRPRPAPRRPADGAGGTDPSSRHSYGTGDAVRRSALRRTPRGRGGGPRGASATAEAAAGRDRARTRWSPG